LEANDIQVTEQVPASRKLQAQDAKSLLSKASKLIVAKGKKVSDFTAGPDASADAVSAMLGPTGNLRAPTIVRGKTVLVGFNEEVFGNTFK
jgi:arsenate reductase-like glutaredoxin family protein